jgi:alcohol dehydrogenase
MLGGMPSNATANSTRRWQIAQAGSLQRLHLETAELAPPGPGEVQVDVVAVGLNFADIFACLGLYSATPQGAFVPGLECAGVIRAIGPRVTSPNTEALSSTGTWQVGDRVIVLTRFGGYSTRLNIDARYLWPVPQHWSLSEAAAYPVQALTAWYGLMSLGRITEKSLILLHSAAGGVGINALRAIGRLGARVIAVVGDEHKRQWLKEQFALSEDNIVLRDQDFAHALDRALAQHHAAGFDLVFDAVYGPVFKAGFSRLAPEGCYVLYGAADFMTRGTRANPLRLAWQYLRRPRLDPLAMISQNRGLRAFNLIWLWEEVHRLPEAMRETLRWIPEPPLIGGYFKFDHALDALHTLQGGKTTGKLVLTIDDHGMDAK